MNVEKYVEKMKNEDDISSFRAYMTDLFNIRRKWAYYYTHQFFSVASQSTQRNESINGVIKRYLVSCSRTKFIRLIDIFDEVITKCEEKVSIIMSLS